MAWPLAILVGCGADQAGRPDQGAGRTPDGGGGGDLPPVPPQEPGDTDEQLDAAEREDDDLPLPPIEDDETGPLREEDAGQPRDGGAQGNRREAGRRAAHEREPLGPLAGRIGSVSVYVGEPERAWTDRERTRTRRKWRAALRRIRRYATSTRGGRPGVPLSLPEEAQRRLDVTLPRALPDDATIPIVSEAVNTAILDAYPHDRNGNGGSTDDLAEAVRRSFALDHVLIAIHMNRPGRSFTYVPVSVHHYLGRRAFLYRHSQLGEGYARIGTYMHETMHAFGALDEYADVRDPGYCACSAASRGAGNANCARCPDVRQVSCIMHQVTDKDRDDWRRFVSCAHTHRHVGWDCPSCGDGVCETDGCEDPARCPEDCPISRCCTETEGNPGESAGRCPRDRPCCCSGGAVCRPTGGGWVCSL